MRREADFPGEPKTIGELMRAPQTTPTRDEAVREAAAFLVDRLNDFESEIGDDAFREWAGHVHPALARLTMALASAPAPASGGVDAVAALKRIRDIADNGFEPKEGVEARIAWIEAELADEPNRPVYGNGNQEPCRNGHEIADLIVEHAGLVARSALSPAATPVSEAGGEAMAISLYRWRVRGEEWSAEWFSCAPPPPNDDIEIETRTFYSALAKPASSPAGGDVDLAEATGTSEFMDPPDGGDVPLVEQVRRMATAFKRRGEDIVALMAAVDSEKAERRQERAARLAFLGAAREALINSGLTREQVIIADNAISEAFRRVREETRHDG